MLRSPYLAEALPEEEEWLQLLRGASGSRFPCRDRSILHLFWSLALTVPDVLALRVEDVDFLAGLIRWGGGAHRGALPPEALRALTAYVSMERAPHCPRLFGDRHGRPMGRRHVSQIFLRLAAATGVDTSPHALRLAALHRLLSRSPVHALTALRPRASSVLASRAE